MITKKNNNNLLIANTCFLLNKVYLNKVYFWQIITETI